jgi:geranylgeranyl pyrophosphate synthase
MRTEQPSAEQVARVVELVADAGGLEYARERAQRFAESADAELDRLPSSPARESLRASITYVLERRS